MNAAAADKSALRSLVFTEIARGRGVELGRAADRQFPPTALDRLSAISPRWRAARTLDRMGATIVAGGYEIAKPSRTRRARRRGADGPADAGQDDRTLWELREWCRDLDRNSPLMRGIIDRMRDNVMAPDYGFRPDSGDEKFDADAAAALAETAPTAEHRGMFDLQQVFETGFRSLGPDGDFLEIFLKDNRLQIIEAHDLVTPRNRTGYKGRRVVGGVETDSSGRPRAYYVRDPSSAPRFGYSGWIGSYRDAQRIDAADVNHVAARTRFSQTRGVPVMAASIGALERLDGYLESESIAAQVASHITWSIRRNADPAGPWLPGAELQTDPNSTADSLSTYEQLMRSEPGAVFDLRPLESVEVNTAGRPTDQFDPYITSMMRMVGSGVGLPLELVLLDFSKTTYASARASLLQAYRTFLFWQRFVRVRMIQPTYDRWMAGWIASGDLRPLAGGRSYKLKFFPPRWAWIDPLKMVLAKSKQISAGAGTLEDWISEEGEVAETIWAARQMELDELRARRIPTTTAPENLSANQESDE